MIVVIVMFSDADDDNDDSHDDRVNRGSNRMAFNLLHHFLFLLSSSTISLQ